MTVKISSKQIDREFLERLEKISGQKVHMCFQCGTCAGACPMCRQMDVSPRRLIRLAQLGRAEEMERLNTCWVCAACHSCEVLCPRGLDIPKIMEALRVMTLRKNEDFIRLAELPAETVKECPQIALVAAFRKFTS